MPNPFTIPGAPAELMARINARRALLAPGAMMMADPPPADPPAQPASGAQPPAGQAPADGFKSEESKQAVLADLHAEREARKQLQQEVAALKGSVGILDDLRKALAPDGKPDPQVDLAAQVAAMRKQLDDAATEAAQHKLATSVAAEHGVTDVGDVALIAAQASEDAMKALAARLKGATPGPNMPKPDPSAGRSGDPKPRTLADAISQHYSTQ